MPSSFRENIPDILKEIEKANPKTILDIGFGRGKYGLLVREYYPDMQIDGLEVFNAYIGEVQRAIYGKVYQENIFEMKEIPAYDLYLIIDVIEHWDKEKAHELLKKLTKHGDVLISTPRAVGEQGAVYGNEWERHVSQWQGSDFEVYPHKHSHNELSFIYLIKKHA